MISFFHSAPVGRSVPSGSRSRFGRRSLSALASALVLAVSSGCEPAPEADPAADSPAAPAAASLPPGADAALERLETSPRHGEWLTVPAGDGDEIRAWVVHPERSDPAPVVVVIHEIFGLTDWIRAVADQLAADGYLVIAPDLLSGMGPGGGGTESVDADGARALIGELERPDARRRIRAAGSYATGLPGASGQIATLGFCWGGSASFDMATLDWDELAAAVVFYGTSPADEELSGVEVPVLGLYAEDDARVNTTIETAAAVLADGGQRFEHEIYPGAGHGFLRQQDGRDGANLAASEAAWPRALSFLREVMGS
ncbi:MAG: dienelactone hydrolase family protein [Gemmatimonadota bacterium]